MNRGDLGQHLIQMHDLAAHINVFEEEAALPVTVTVHRDPSIEGIV